ncbi:hypothetical protein ACSBR1_016165 [Camellia fascicularis]
MEHNPGTYINIEYDDHTDRFIRYFISFKACIDGFNHCWTLLFLDATFLKGRFKGFLLAATAKDGNKVVHGNIPPTFISDRNLGLLEAMPIVFPNAEHTFCLQHLQRNLRDRLWTCRSIQILSKCTSTTLGKCIFQGRCYGEMCSNAAESFNSWVREAFNLPIIRMVDSIRAKLMRQMVKHRLAAQTWTGTICPKMESRLEKAFNEGRSWKLNGFPCAHAMVAIWKSGRDLNTLVELYFHVGEYRSTYAANISPMPTVEQLPFNLHDYIIYPPAVKRPLGRPKKKRILSKEELV